MEVNPNIQKVKMIDLTIRAKEKNERNQEKSQTLYDLKYKRSFSDLSPNNNLCKDKIIPIINKSKSKDEIVVNNNNYKSNFVLFGVEFSFNALGKLFEKLNIKTIQKKYYNLKNVITDSFTINDNFYSKIS